MRGAMRAFLSAALGLMLLAGCGRPQQAPVVPEAVPTTADVDPSGAPAPSGEATGAPPRLVDRLLYRATPVLSRVVDGITVVRLEPWQREVAVGSGAVEITWQLDADDARPYRGLLRTEGAEPAQVRTVLGVIQARFEPPLPDRWSAWLEGVAGSHTVLVRYPEPTVALSYRGPDGALVPLEGHEAVVPAGPLRLVLDFDQAVDDGSLTAWLDGVRECAGEQRVTLGRGAGHRWWIDMDEAPARLHLDLRSVVAASSGLSVARDPLTLWSEASLPYLERVDLTTGDSQALLTLPPAIREARPSPDGAWIALRSWRSLGDEWRDDRVIVVDLAENRLIPTELDGGALHWVAGRLLNRPPGGAAWQLWDPSAAEAGPPPGLPPAVPAAAAFSPDGRTAAYLAPGGAGGTDRAGYALALVDVETGAARTIPGFLEGEPLLRSGAPLPLEWSPDGSRIAALAPRLPAGGSRVVIYDREEDDRRVLTAPLPVPAWEARLAWSPRGDHLLVLGESGGAWIVPLEGGPPVPVEEAGAAPAFWDAAGDRILAAAGPWKGVFVYRLADGSRVELGDGLPAGWAGDAVYVIRWPGAGGGCGPLLR